MMFRSKEVGSTMSEIARMDLTDAFLEHYDSPVMREACITRLRKVIKDPPLAPQIKIHQAEAAAK